MADEIIPTCKHVKPNGTFCKSPALGGDKFCYFHRAARERQKRRASAFHAARALQMPVLEDLETIQLSIGEVLNALVSERITPKVAGLLLFGLQTASSNARHVNYAVAQNEEVATEYKEYDDELKAETREFEQREAAAALAAVPEAKRKLEAATDAYNQARIDYNLKCVESWPAKKMIAQQPTQPLPEKKPSASEREELLRITFGDDQDKIEKFKKDQEKFERKAGAPS